MKKKNIISIIIVLLLLIIGGLVFMFVSKSKEVSQAVNLEQIDNNTEENMEPNNQTAVIYFSATGTTKRIAELISETTGSDIIEIVPTEAYTDDDLNYTNDNSRANQEQNDDSARPEIKNEIDTSDYDTIYLGYPIWWGGVPRIIQTFVESNDLGDKTIIPFCTSGSSGISTSLSTLRAYEGLNVLDGKRFSTSATKSDIENWLNEISGGAAR